MTDIKDLWQARYGAPWPGETEPEVSGTLERLLGHRSYRRFTDRPVPESLKSLLFAAAQSASAKSDLQQYSIIDVTDRARKERLGELSGMEWFKSAPVALLFCGDINRNRRITELRGKTYAQNTLDSFMNAAVDAALAMQNMTVAADALGMGCCCVSHVRNWPTKVSDLFNLPPGVFPMAGWGAGWPSEERDVTLRLPPETVIHENEYDDLKLEAEIAAYDARRHAARPIPEAGQLHTDIFGVAEDYRWSENTARRLSQPEGNEPFKSFLQAHGFELS